MKVAMAVLVSSHGSSATIVATVSENRKAWWDDILWLQVRMMTWSRFPEVGILGTKDEKAILRNWFSGVIDVGGARVGLEINK